jgi:hypothetical protein
MGRENEEEWYGKRGDAGPRNRLSMVEDGRSDQLAGKWRFSKFAQVIVSAKLDIGTLSVVSFSGSSLRERLP